MTRKIGCALALALGLADTAGTDVWDPGDNVAVSHNEITHGIAQAHDLGVQTGPAPDQDWFMISQQPFASYEILADGFTFWTSPYFGTTLQRVTSAGTVLQDSVAYGAGIGLARSLRFANDTSTVINNQYVLVANAGCNTSCGTQDEYRIRAWETTIAVPRYNNFGGQTTVLIIQNTEEVGVSGNARLWTASGGSTPVTTVAFTLGARQASVVNLASVNGGVANGTAGTITITHDGRYGQLAVKAVALESATGFSFDSPGLYKPH
jgi:hypothetical protein